MVNKIDKGEYKFIDLEFIQRTNLRYAPASIDPDGERSLKHLQNIVDSELPMIKTICLEHAAAKWLKPEELDSVKWLPTDEEIIKDLMK